MIIKKGKIEYVANWSPTMKLTIKATVIEKTQGGYSEILFCRDSYEVTDNGNVTTGDRQDTFKVYQGVPIDEVLRKNEIYQGYIWTTPLTEVV